MVGRNPVTVCEVAMRITEQGLRSCGYVTGIGLDFVYRRRRLFPVYSYYVEAPFWLEMGAGEGNGLRICREASDESSE